MTSPFPSSYHMHTSHAAYHPWYTHTRTYKHAHTHAHTHTHTRTHTHTHTHTHTTTQTKVTLRAGPRHSSRPRPVQIHESTPLSRCAQPYEGEYRPICTQHTIQPTSSATCTVWPWGTANTSKTYIKTLATLQNTLIRLICNVPTQSTHNTPDAAAHTNLNK